jgi:hypothetical protein
MITNIPSETRHAASEVKSPTPKVANRRRPCGARLKAVSPEARKMAAAILEVLAGTRSPSDAAGALGVTPAHYYQLETRALNGLLVACEPYLGTARSIENQLIAARKDVQRLQQECARYSTLVRATQRTIGLGPPKPVKLNENGNGKRLKRKPTVRALKAATLLINLPLSGETEASSAGEHLTKG